MSGARCWAVRAAGLGLALAASGAAADPVLPPGQDPGGHAIAVIGTGIDYTDPVISARLARDGEGDLIGWDFADGDNRPHGVPDSAEHAAVATVLRDASAKLIPVRIKPGEPHAFARALAFAAATPARHAVLVVLPASGAEWEILAEAMQRFPDLEVSILSCPVAKGSAPASVSGPAIDVPALPGLKRMACAPQP